MSSLCQFQPNTDATEWTCSVCKFVAITNALPERPCDLKPINVDPRIKARKSRRSPPTTPAAPRDPWDSERQYQQIVPRCLHRGAVIETNVPCQACGQRGQTYEVYQCDRHGKCSLGNRRAAGDATLQACVTCPDGPNVARLSESGSPPTTDNRQPTTPPSSPLAPRGESRSTPSVAVVIISHNYGRFLTEAIESVLNQTAKPAEIIVVDDASTDNTPEVAMRYTGSVRYLRIDARDVNAAREAGFRSTKSECLVFLDADDMLPPDYLASGLPLFTNPHVAIAYSDHQQFGNRTDRVVHPHWGERSIHGENFIHSASIVRRSALEATSAFVGLPDMTRCAHHNDWALWRRVLTRGRIAAKQTSALLYRQHGDNWLTKGWTERPTYYNRSALCQEPLTIFVALSGRLDAADDVVSWLDRQTHPREVTRLVLCDTSQDTAFHQRLRAWAANCDYPDVRVVAKTVGAKGLAEQDRVHDLAVRQQVCEAMWRIYDQLSGLETEYILTIEDDVLPPDDAVARLFRGFEANVFSVASPYRSRYAGWIAWDKPYSLLREPRTGLQPTQGSGFGCTILRRSVLQQWTIGPYKGSQDYDVAIYHWLADQGQYRALIDWDCRSIHAGLLP